MSNQYVTITPNTVEVNEFENVTLSYTVAHEPPAEVTDLYDYVLHDVIIDPSTPTWCNVKWSKAGNLSFVLTGAFSDVFDRQFKYVTKSNVEGSATRFAYVPNDYGALYSYSPPSSMQITLTNRVILRPNNIPINTLSESDYHSYTFFVVVRNNLQTANAKFVELVKTGGWAKDYGNQ